jgi:hypothetical protein
MAASKEVTAPSFTNNVGRTPKPRNRRTKVEKSLNKKKSDSLVQTDVRVQQIVTPLGYTIPMDVNTICHRGRAGRPPKLRNRQPKAEKSLNHKNESNLDRHRGVSDCLHLRGQYVVEDRFRYSEGGVEMKAELRFVEHTQLPGQCVIEVRYDGKLIGWVCGADGPGIRFISRHQFEPTSFERGIGLTGKDSKQGMVIELRVRPGTLNAEARGLGMKP